MNESDVFSKILSNNVDRERNTLSQYACKSNQGIRKFPEREKIPDRINIRPVFYHDTDKIIHSRAYTRYIDKTQVFSLFENDHITHRVLHVQFVSKIGRVIGRCLKLNEDLIEAISLGHDLGHVPYGHDGERVLNEICKKNGIGYFYHNVQSVRFLMEIENNGEGLNLSLQVLDGILAHNGEMLSPIYQPEFDKTWTTFDDDYNKCFLVEDYSKHIYPMTLEGCVVRISDVIAYIGRDIEDAITLRLIERKDIPHEITKYLGDTNDQIINTLVMDLVKNSYDKGYLEFSEDIYNAIKELKDFNYKNIYLNSKIKTELHKSQKMFWMLCEKYFEDLESESKQSPIYQYFLKNMSPEYCRKTHPKRKVIDFIAGMTDDFFNSQFKETFLPQSYGYFLEPDKKEEGYRS